MSQGSCPEEAVPRPVPVPSLPGGGLAGGRGQVWWDGWAGGAPLPAGVVHPSNTCPVCMLPPRLSLPCPAPHAPQKCATTSLFHNLKDHPSIIIPVEKASAGHAFH